MPPKKGAPSPGGSPSVKDSPTASPLKKKARLSNDIAGSPGSPGKGKATTPRKIKADHKIIEPGDPANPRTFYNEYKTEAVLGAYCGYKSIGELRKFELSHFFGQFQQFFMDSEWLTGMEKHQALELIRDRFLVVGHEDMFPLDRASSTKYLPGPKPNKSDKGAYDEWDRKRKKFLAHLLILMVDRLSGEGPLVVKQDRQERIEQKRVTIFQLEDDLPSLPAKTEIIRPVFNTGIAEESALEPFNRAWILIKGGQHAFMPTNIARFTRKGWDDDIKITDDYLPEFMRPKLAAPLLKAPAPKAPKLPPIQITLKKIKGPDEQALKDLWEEEELPSLTTKISQPSGDPRVLTKAQFRDSIRNDFRCVESRCDISRVDAIVVNGDDEDRHNLSSIDWTDLRGLINTSMQPVVFEVAFRLVEQDETIFECDAPPPQLQDILEFNEAGDGVQAVKDVEGSNENDNLPDVVSDAKLLPSNPQSYIPDPKKYHKGSAKHQDFLDYYDGYDVTKDSERLSWQKKVIEEILEAANPEDVRTIPPGKGKGKAKLKKQLVEKLEASAHEAHHQATSADESTLHDTQTEEKYFQILRSFTGSQEQVGPPLQLSALVLGMEEIPQDNPKVPSWKCTLIPEIGRRFYSYQVTGAAHMLMRMFGRIPVPKSHLDRPGVREAWSILQHLQLFGVINADATGLGKTIETLLAVAFAVSFAFGARELAEGFTAPKTYKPVLLDVPKNPITEWAAEIDRHWTKVFKLIISYDASPFAEALQQQVISASTMKNLPDDREPFSTGTEQHFGKLFDGSFYNVNAVVLSSHDTHAHRQTRVHKEVTKPVSHAPQKQFDENGKEIFKVPARTVVSYITLMRGQYSLVVVDEVHAMKNILTRLFASVWLMEADYHILVTATTMQNSHTDTIALHMLLWQRVRKHVDSTPDLKEFAVKLLSGWEKVFKNNEITELDAKDPKRLLLMDPVRIGSLLQSDDPRAVMDFYHLVDDMVALRRSPASKIPKNAEKTEFIHLRDLMQPHAVITKLLKRTGPQADQYEWYHKDAADRFEQMSLGGDNKVKEVKVPASGQGVPISNEGRKFAYPVVPLRDLDLANTSVLLARMNAKMRKMKANTLVAQMQQWRTQGMDGEQMADFSRTEFDRACNTRADYIKLFADSSVVFVEILREIRDHVLKGEKVLFIEQVPLSAFWYWLGFQLLLIPSAVFHADLNSKARTSLMADFNAKGGLMALVNMIDVGGVGVNLQQNCCRAFVTHIGISFAKFVQAIGRIIRANQENKVTVVVPHVQDSHSAWRVYRHSSKAVIELASHANDPEVKEILVLLLNEYRDQCQDLWSSSLGDEIRKLFELDPTLFSEAPTADLAGTFNDTSKTQVEELQAGTQFTGATSTNDSENRRRSTRVRNAPDRYNPLASFCRNPTSFTEEERRYFMAHWIDDNEALARAAAEQAEEEDDADVDDDNDVFQGGEDKPDKIRELLDAYQSHLDQLNICEFQRMDYTEELLEYMSMLRKDPSEEITVDDLKDPLILRRGLLLLYRERLGQPFLLERASIHIKYGRLGSAVAKATAKSAGKVKDAKQLMEKLGITTKAPDTSIDKDANKELGNKKVGVLHMKQFSSLSKRKQFIISPEEQENVLIQEHEVFKNLEFKGPYERLTVKQWEAYFVENGVDENNAFEFSHADELLSRTLVGQASALVDDVRKALLRLSDDEVEKWFSPELL